MGNFYGKALLIDNNVKFLEEIKKEENLMQDFPCLITKNFKEATMALNQDKRQVRAIFISSAISESHGLEELKSIKEKHPLLPVFLITHRPELDPPEIFSPEIGFQKVIREPKNFRRLTEEMQDLFYSKEKWDDVSATDSQKFIELEAKGIYIPISLREFVFTPKSYFNLHIKIGASKLIKILNAGEPVDKAFLDQYAKKGISELYISADEQKKYLKLCEEFSKNIINKMSKDLVNQARGVLNLGANVYQNLVHTGITSEKLDFANSFLNQSLLLVRNLRIQNTTLKSFLDSVELVEHASSVSLFAGIIAKEVGFESTKSVKQVGMASLIHDIGLFELAPDVKDELELLGGERKEIFNKHAKSGADLLRSTEQFDEVICLAVEQHHMRRRGNDPLRRSNNLNLVAEILGAADELHNFLKVSPLNQERLSLFIREHLSLFSPQIEKAVIKLLQNK